MPVLLLPRQWPGMGHGTQFPETSADKTQAVSSLRTFDALYKTSALGMTLDLNDR